MDLVESPRTLYGTRPLLSSSYKLAVSGKLPIRKPLFFLVGAHPKLELQNEDLG